MFSKTAQDNEQLLTALDKSQAIIHFKPDGTILWANANFLGAMGYTLEEIAGKHHSLFVDSAYASSEAYKEFWKNLAAGKFQSAQYKRYAKGGREIWIEASYNPVFDKNGKVTKVVKFATDITQKTLQFYDFQGQLDAIGKSQAVIHFNMDGTILWANENFLSAVGYTLDEIKGKHHRMFATQELANSKEYTLFWENLNKGIYDCAEYKRIGKGGKEIWIQASYNPILDPNGKPFKVVKYATDITADVLKRQEKDKTGKQVDHNLSLILAEVESVSAQADVASNAANETASTVQTVAAGAEELSSSIQEISQSMNLSQRAVQTAFDLTDKADISTKELSEATKQMSGIVSMIQDIANQINLLALNATIESARAGEAGKGFAVVASEVKNLATQVGQATDKISEEIGGIQRVSSDVVNALGTIKQSIEEVKVSVTGVASAIEEQTAVTSEISNNMQVASDACQEVNRSLSNVNQSVKVTEGYVSDVQKLSHVLTE